MTYIEIAEKCLDKFWNPKPDYSYYNKSEGRGWDNGSPAHKHTVTWAKINYTILKRLTWKKVYELYLVTLRQE